MMNNVACERGGTMKMLFAIAMLVLFIPGCGHMAWFKPGAHLYWNFPEFTSHAATHH